MKKNHITEFKNFFSVLSNETRLQILLELMKSCSCQKQTEMCVYEINNTIDLPQPYISKHLKILRNANILEYRKEGNRIFYKFSDEAKMTLAKVIEFFDSMKCCLD